MPEAIAEEEAPGVEVAAEPEVTAEPEPTQAEPEPTPAGLTTPQEAPQSPDVTPGEAPATKKATRAKKTPKVAQNASAPREGSKTMKVLELMKREGGVTLKEIMAATDWQAHSVRGFISGTLGKKMGLTVFPLRPRTGSALTRSSLKRLTLSSTPPDSTSAASLVWTRSRGDTNSLAPSSSAPPRLHQMFGRYRPGKLVCP